MLRERGPCQVGRLKTRRGRRINDPNARDSRHIKRTSSPNFKRLALEIIRLASKNGLQETIMTFAEIYLLPVVVLGRVSLKFDHHDIRAPRGRDTWNGNSP